MLRFYTRYIGNGIRNCHLNNKPERITQFSRNYSDGNYDCKILLKIAQKVENRKDKNDMFDMLADQKPKFSISDEIIDGRPLYLDAQATTPLVS